MKHLELITLFSQHIQQEASAYDAAFSAYESAQKISEGQELEALGKVSYHRGRYHALRDFYKIIYPQDHPLRSSQPSPTDH